MRTIRNRAAAAAVTALVASLALTACGTGDTSAASAGAVKDSVGTVASSSTPPAEQQAPTDNKQQPADQISSNGSNSGTSNGTGTTSGGTAKPGSNTGNSKSGNSKSGTATKDTTCTGANTKVKVSEVTRPINHLLLTVTNTGSTNCNAYYAPLLRFDEAQAATQINEDSQPQAVVTLAPGDSAYASITLGGADGAPTTPADNLTVHFPGRDNQGSEGSPAGPISLPAGTSIADSASVTYWQADMADALTW
ncbi:DUF4232 domain-containing protein [Streptomyces sp. NPDC102274]|uniref:DUF4232 domain-containing protein n=1 Tax=Streptomyces sp. NPDC102274 TaxID=3366151 RepID=UPI003809E83E